MKNKKISFLITNGNKIFKVYWISQSKAGDIYHGSYLNKNGSHNSYHKSGTMHFKSEGKYYPLGNSIPIKEIKDMYILGAVSIPSRSLETNYLEEYDGKKFEYPVLLDTRLFPKSWTTCIDFTLIKSSCINLLNSPMFTKKDKGDIRILQIVTAFDPWIVLQLRAFKSR